MRKYMPERSWVLRAWRDEGLLYVSAHGTATAEAIRTLRAFTKAAIGEHDDKAVLVDLREAQFEMNLEDWRLAAVDSARAGFKPPVAFIVPVRHFAFAEVYCVKAALNGQRRMAFTDFDRAVCWAQKRRGAAPAAPAPAPPLSRPKAKLRLVRPSPR
jgi:hypothetical protein